MWLNMLIKLLLKLLNFPHFFFLTLCLRGNNRILCYSKPRWICKVLQVCLVKCFFTFFPWILLPRWQLVERVFFSIFNIWHVGPLFRGVSTGFTKMLFGAWTQWLTKWYLCTLKEFCWIAFSLLWGKFNLYICTLCPCFIWQLHRTTCCNYGYFNPCFYFLSLSLFRKP